MDEKNNNLVEEWWLLRRVFVAVAVSIGVALLDDEGVCGDLAPAILRRRGWYL